MEIWKKIKGFENYEISNYGRVRSLNRNICLKQVIKNGYLYVGIYKDRKHKNLRVHRLVAEAFIPNPEKKLQVNHINGNKLDNNIINLEWATQSENMLHAYKNGLNHTANKETSKQRGKYMWDNFREKIIERISIKVNQYDKNNKFIKTWKSAEEVKRKLKILHVRDCCNGKRKTAGGFVWKNAERS